MISSLALTPPAKPRYRVAMDFLDHLQWPAMAASLIAAWLVASQSKRRRKFGFGWFLASNALWIAWGWHAHAWALIALQIGLVLLNCRSVAKNTPGNGDSR